MVDDDLKISSYVAKGLREAGFAVDMVANGTDALAVVRTTPFDVAVASRVSRVPWPASPS